MPKVKKVDVIAELETEKQKKQAKKAFLDDLDSQHLKFKTYLLAVAGYYQCSPYEAGIIIAKHMKGEY